MAPLPPLTLLPFGLLLALIALAPLCFAEAWRRHYPKITFGLAALVVAYYFFSLHASARIGETAHEYVSFILLIGSLFIVSGGIHITIKGEATPLKNTLFLLVGALAANLLGTTGASMLLIRPWLRMNQNRVAGHHVVFFILIISNVGGCLTPIADPPLFLGYLMGVPFSWVVAHCLPIWATGVTILLAMFFVVDQWSQRRGAIRARESINSEQWRFEGLGNLFFLAVIIGAVFLNEPPLLREALMTAAAIASYCTTRKSVHEANRFNLHPLQEVAILFAGIFATMMPALDWLQANAGQWQAVTPGWFYWGSGILSSVLDNAPTYVCFLKASFGRFVDPEIVTQVTHLAQTHGADLANLTGAHAEQVRQTFAALQKYHAGELAAGRVTADQVQVACLIANPGLNLYLVAISVGAVFFGANTYIGNGPNFMVKAIADQEKIPVPTFFGYIFKYTLPFMLPMLLVIWWIFFR